MYNNVADSEKFFGHYRGVVVDNKDPDGHRRIKVKIPQLNDVDVTNYVWPKEVSSVRSEVPDIGDGVWIVFEGGDPSYPIWTGTFGKPTKDKRVNIKVLRDTTSLSGIQNTHIITERTTNGTTEVDLVATLLAMANKIKTLETDLALVRTTLATRSSNQHTHTNNG
jgi:hypothetical protein